MGLDNEEMARKLRTLRGNRPQQEVASAVGISVSALSMYEQGERIPRDDVKLRLAKYYHRSVGFIFFNPTEGGSDENHD